MNIEFKCFDTPRELVDWVNENNVKVISVSEVLSSFTLFYEEEKIL